MTNIDQPSKVEERENQKAIEVVSISKIAERVRELHSAKAGFPIAILFGGDRLSCCDEGIVMNDNGKLIGLATIAPEGEENSGQPTIVGLYVLPEYRQKGFGAQILKRTLERCIERGLNKNSKIRMDVLSSKAQKIIDKFPKEFQDKIEVHNYGDIMDNF